MILAQIDLKQQTPRDTGPLTFTVVYVHFPLTGFKRDLRLNSLKNEQTRRKLRSLCQKYLKILFHSSSRLAMWSE